MTLQRAYKASDLHSPIINREAMAFLIILILSLQTAILFASASAGQDFLVYRPDLPVDSISDCNETGVKCVLVEVKFDVISKAKALNFPEDQTLPLLNQTEQFGVTTYSYENGDDSAFLSIDRDEDLDALVVYGKMHFMHLNGTILYLEYHSADYEALIYSPPSDQVLDDLNEYDRDQHILGPLLVNISSMVKASPDDRASPNIIDLALHYAPGITSARPKLLTAVADFNTILRRNELPFQVRALCVSALKVAANPSSGRMNNIIEVAGSWSNLLKSADMAVVFYARTVKGTCGRASDFDPIRGGFPPFAWVAMSCRSRYVFEHEIGHILGARHEKPRDSAPGRNHGYHIPNSPYFTIMAYASRRHNKKLPYFSRNGAYYKNKWPLGDGQASNYHKFLETYQKYARFGDGSQEGVCGDPCTDMFDCSRVAQRNACNSVYMIRYDVPIKYKHVCPKSCKACVSSGGGGCLPDRANWCSDYKRYCHGTRWSEHMNRLCDTTCNC